MLRVIVCFLIMLSIINANNLTDKELINKYIKELNNLSKEQKDILYYTYKHNSKLGMYLATIAWKESNLGKWLINSGDGKYGSYGLYHINMDYHSKSNKLSSRWEIDREKEKLLLDKEYSTTIALSHINYWRNKYSNKSNKEYMVFLSYNGGYNISTSNTRAHNYAKDAMLRQQAIRQYMSSYYAVK